MLKTLLVPLNGSAGDRAALETALLAGQPFSAHLDCVHVPPQVSDLIGQAALSDYDGQGYAAAAALSCLDQRSREAVAHARNNLRHSAASMRSNAPAHRLPSAPARNSGSYPAAGPT